MLYDTSRTGNLSADWFDPRLLLQRGPVEPVAAGRGAAWFIAPEGPRWVLRHYRRGGLIAAIAADRYLWWGEQATRPFAEWLLTYHLHRAGLPVPAPVAASYRRDGFSYRGALITERLEGVQSLAQCLGTGALSLLNWIAIGRCIRRFHDAGACHADLNAHNVLLGEGDAVHLIDFDRGSLRPPGLWRDGNLVRLRRSLEKVCYGLPAERFTEADWHGLLDGYQLPGGLPAAARG